MPDVEPSQPDSPGKEFLEERTGVGMASEDLVRQAQDAVDELYAEGRLPFSLTAFKVERDQSGVYHVVTFYDARLDDVVVLWQHSLSFKQAVRDAVLRRLHVNNL